MIADTGPRPGTVNWMSSVDQRQRRGRLKGTQPRTCDALPLDAAEMDLPLTEASAQADQFPACGRVGTDMLRYVTRSYVW